MQYRIFGRGDRPAGLIAEHVGRAIAACEGDAIASANRGLVQVFADAGGNGTIRVAAN